MSQKIKDLASLKANAKQFDADLTELLAKYGLVMITRRGSIGGGQCNFTIKTTYLDEKGTEEKARDEYVLYSDLLGLPKDSFGKNYMLNGDVYKVVGCNPSKPKNCVSIKRVRDGKTFVCPPTSLHRQVA